MNDAVGEPGFHNRYSYTGGNPVNRVDRNGMCWQHSGSTNEQKNQCNSAFNAYTNEWRQVYGNENRWPSSVMQSYRQEGRYWSGLSYNAFVRQWNSSRPAGHMTAGQRLQQGATLALGGAAITGPTPDDILLLAGALCLYAASQAALAGSIALPMRQPYYFTQSNDDAESQDREIPWSPSRERDDEEEIYYYYTDLAGYTDITSRIPITIRANERNQVFVTQMQYGPYDAWIALFIGNQNKRHNGEYFLEFTLSDGVILTPGTQPNEMIHYGTMRQGREIEFVLRHGPNPFEDQWR